jgi:hypothetical protein
VAEEITERTWPVYSSRTDFMGTFVNTDFRENNANAHPIHNLRLNDNFSFGQDLFFIWSDQEAATASLVPVQACKGPRIINLPSCSRFLHCLAAGYWVLANLSCGTSGE